MKSTNKPALKALTLILSAAAISWLLVMLGQYADLLKNPAGYYSDEYSDSPTLNPSKYIFLVAAAVFAFAPLVAKKRLLVTPANGTHTNLFRSVNFFANTALIIALVINAIMGVSVFIEGFFTSYAVAETGKPPATFRLLETYLPILLYTFIVIFVLLSGFIFNKNTAATQSDGNRLLEAPADLPISQDDSNPVAAQKSAALGWSIPIITVAFGLIVGLIVYDLTGTSLEVWIWVLILAFVAVGIYLGVRFSSQSLLLKKDKNGIAHGAATLNLVLAIMFTVIVGSMSFGYGSSAIDGLRSNHSLNISVYSNEGVNWQGDTVKMRANDMLVTANVDGLSNGSKANLTLTPVGTVLATETTDRYGYTYIDTEFNEELKPGAYSFLLEAESDVSPNTLELNFEVQDDGTALFLGGSDAYTANDSPELRPLSFEWIVEEFLPAFVLLLLVVCLLRRTIITRAA